MTGDKKKIVEHPERVSGVWEMEVAPGRTIGLHIILLLGFSERRGVMGWEAALDSTGADNP
jgi:hypothetical protein